MKLDFSLPEGYYPALALKDDEKIEYCVPFDIDGNGDVLKNGFTVVTRRRIVVLQDGNIINEVAIKDCDDVRCEAMVDCGLLVCTSGGKDKILCRFSMRHTVRYSYIARGARLFHKNDYHPVESLEPELICEKCGHAIPGLDYCPRCQGSKRTAKLIWSMSKPYIWGFALLTLAMIVVTLITLWQQDVQKRFIDNVLVPIDGVAASLSELPSYILLLAVSIFALIIMEIVKRLISVYLGSRISKDLRRSLFAKIQTLSLSYQHTRKPGDLMNRVTGDTAEIRNFIENVFSNVFNILISLIGALIAMLSMDWSLTLLAMVLMPVVLLLNRLFRRKIHRMFHNQRRKSDRLNSHLQDVLSGIRVVKCFGREKHETDSFAADADSFARTQIHNETFWALFQPILGFLTGFGTCIVLYVGGRGIIDGTGFTIGEMSQFVAYAGMIYWPLGWLSNIPRMIMNMTVSLSRVDDIMGQSPDITETKDPIEREIEGTVEFKNMTFGYKNYEPVLENINFTVKPGEMIGLVGASGSGKSTMINLIMRLYDRDEGEILIDGVDIKDYSSECLHSQIGVVLQETFLFADTIMNNIKFSKPDATYEEVVRAAKIAGAHDFICRFPDGYDTFVGDGGSRVSGGERQRIAIARAVLGNPRLLILDEATSSLDTENEFMIQKGLERLKEGRTTFAIAHRLSTLKNADRLFVIDNHHIAETGTHDELMKYGKIYKGLVEAQMEMHAVRPDAPPPHHPGPPPPRH